MNRNRDMHTVARLWRAALLAAFCICAATVAMADENARPAGFQNLKEESFLYFLFGGGGFIGMACTVPILCMSVAAIALYIEHLFTLRRSVLMPNGLAEEVHGHIANASYAHAEQQCKLRPSVLGDVILAGLREVRQGFAAVEKAMEDSLHAHASRILRKIEFLSVIANISTMLGLFGTVVGLVLAFKKVADTQGVARAADLAGGIYLALMTTIEGLAIAIPTVGLYAIFKYRADNLVAQTALLADYAFSEYKKQSQGRRIGDPARGARFSSGS
jgi:biopolymer transport protein ExbB